MSFSLSDPSLGVIVVPGMFMVRAEAPGGGGGWLESSQGGCCEGAFTH